MGQITSLFVHKFIQQVDHSLNVRSLLEPMGIDLDMPIDPTHMVLDLDYYSLLEKVARADPTDPNAADLPLRTAFKHLSTICVTSSPDDCYSKLNIP